MPLRSRIRTACCRLVPYCRCCRSQCRWGDCSCCYCCWWWYSDWVWCSWECKLASTSTQPRQPWRASAGRSGRLSSTCSSTRRYSSESSRAAMMERERSHPISKKSRAGHMALDFFFDRYSMLHSQSHFGCRWSLCRIYRALLRRDSLPMRSIPPFRRDTTRDHLTAPASTSPIRSSSCACEVCPLRGTEKIDE